ncbi:MFS transporter [Gordonia rubripertincta]|uniref:MFS transporter n=1 Tax=Gordonia rubripertincta TaxID=36822 RepID=A0AAW4G9Q6_GORRU|nr:MFS transporter [Gordonia rubripertincta]MBM7279928.1 MFS transporter [Gordonia rubripertincta]QMU22267.1 MFS transporter [Gordonia rubripertincta]TSD94304.1 MFS transporter [Gordonia rubripertincta]
MTDNHNRFGWPAVSLAVFAAAWGGNEFTPLLVMYRQITDLSPVVVDALLFAYVLGIVPALLIGGPLSDRFGRRPLMLPAPVFAALGSVLLAAGSQSAALLTVGRICSGIALGLSMAVGGSWIKELSDRDGARAGAGAGRAAMSLTAGFGVGAGVAGVLAEWGPWPHVLPYLVNIAIAVCALALLTVVPETRFRSSTPGRLIDDLRIPAAGHRRFMFVVLPVAPWVFGAAASAYAIIPALMSARTSGAPIAFAALCCVLGLGAGFGIQSVGRRIDMPGSSRGVVVALTALVAGMLVAALAAHVLTVWLSLVAATLLGCGYGMALIAGLLEVQRIAGPDDLAGLTAVFYSVTYLGFAVPALLAWITETWTSITYTEMFLFGAIAALACLAVAMSGHTRHRPETRPVAVELPMRDEGVVTGQSH